MSDVVIALKRPRREACRGVMPGGDTGTRAGSSEAAGGAHREWIHLEEVQQRFQPAVRLELQSLQDRGQFGWDPATLPLTHGAAQDVEQR